MNRTVRFLQSVHDFPCMVSLGDKVPAWGLSRWTEAGLRFLPPDDDEGFTLRGDRRRLVYRGRKRSHRFTILGDTSFEYDCILNREPESTVITILMEGAEHFDFFRQPDFVKDPFLKGSYAVYKKETLVGEGTGKLCHIYRPLIIDSRGRRCWGDLSVTGNKLCITIPETWLSGAKYPVVVDPTIGTAAIGSQNKWYDPDNEATASLMFELSIPVNRFLVSETVNGTCTAYVYTNEDDYEAGGRPVLYSDSGNTPRIRKSAQEGFLDLRITGSKPKGWRSASFLSSGSIASGSYVWFGVFAECYWLPRFDYGARCYTDWWWDYGVETAVPDEYPLSSADYYRDFKLSMYFTYTSAQTYTRTLTQGVKFTDTRKLTGTYKRSMAQTAGGTAATKGFAGFYRSIIQSVKNTVILKGSPMRIVRLIEAVAVLYEMKAGAGFNRGTADTAGIGSMTGGMVTFFRALFGLAEGGDSTGGLVTRIRRIQDMETIGDDMGHVSDYLRGLFEEAGSIAGTTHRGEYYRVQQDTAGSEAVPLRHLFIFLRILTAAYIRDYIIGRFLKSKEEIIIKSPVCREIILESTLH